MGDEGPMESAGCRDRSFGVCEALLPPTFRVFRMPAPILLTVQALAPHVNLERHVPNGRGGRDIFEIRTTLKRFGATRSCSGLSATTAG